MSPFITWAREGDYVPPEQRALDAGEPLEDVNDEKENESEEDSGHVDESDSGEEEDEESKDDKKDMNVSVGLMEKFDDDHEAKMEKDEEYKLRVMMIKSKHRHLYRSMMKNRNKRMREAKLKEAKRKEWDKNEKKTKKKSE